MKVLVTGGAGFIGANLVRALLSRGDEVVVLDNLSSGYRQNLPTGCSFVEAGVEEEGVVVSAAAGASAIFHLAASVGNKRSIDDPIGDATTNVLGTIRVMEAARSLGIEKVVVSSSAGVFGELKTLPIREDHPLDPDTPYGCTKLCEERMAMAYGKLYGTKVVCLRYFNVYGPFQRYDAYGNVIPIFAFRLLRGEPLIVFGDGEQTRDFVNVADVVQANLRAAELHEAEGVFNLGSGTRVSINRLIEMLGHASGIPPELRYDPPRPGDVRDSLADIDAARQTLGFQPSCSLEEGLSTYVDWARTELG